MRNRTRLSACAAAAAAMLVSTGLTTASATADPAPTRATPAPLYRSSAPVEGQYIVSLAPGAADAATLAKQMGLKSLFTYSSVISGFAAKLTPEQLNTVRSTAGVAAVEQDAVVTAVGSPRPGRAPAASWGIDRIDQTALPLDQEFTVSGTGAGTTGYILDTGIEYGHSEFGGRARYGYDAVGDGRAGADCNGHGTHVAGTVGGATYGVARQADLVSVRVLDCEGSGTWSGVMAGLDWIALEADQPAVMNASLGGAYSRMVNDALDRVAASGVVPVVAAGNDDVDACDVSPASAPRAFTVGASDTQDREASFSNHGECLAIYAPGTAIVSAKLGGGSVAHNGTSMAAPHVAGVALLARQAAPAAGAEAIESWLLDASVKDSLTVDFGSPNRLVNTGGL
ncbi:S8 family peptidase [Streptomyces sp. t39]|uniref:S8 family peptidase n=1 Tax=Streptomyces sp. t39 TaxID=1828156 RepID=UPI0011CE6DCC|nr:S8 family peptidase [Streptomyces sp. t39]TXS57901.1 S8 family peptidase [Streptomyces sp. t39]